MCPGDRPCIIEGQGQRLLIWDVNNVMEVASALVHFQLVTNPQFVIFCKEMLMFLAKNISKSPNMLNSGKGS